MEKIDFVLTWVDGSDAAWLSEKQKYQEKSELSKGDANAVCRYRADTDMLRYWFRAVEKFAPWVNKIWFVTCGQKPEWLTEDHTKLALINHTDYMPKEYLPTFNSNAIELNYHRIDGLAEKYVMFNDDMFLLQPVDSDFFFKGGNPVLVSDLKYPSIVGYNNWSRILFNNYCVVNNSFCLRKSIKDNWKKWFNIKELGLKRARQNLVCYLANKTLPVGIYGHIALPHLKSTLQEVWERWYEVMDSTSSHRFRSDDQVNQWMLCAWNQASGKFYPTTEKKRGINISINPGNIDWAAKIVKTQEYPMICLNDTYENTNPDYSTKMLVDAFETILPEKSAFEKPNTH
ncbi:MAG: stealth family protein [Bacteroidales bacterium]|nr:stealth family protein [Bacteroidales bacterium]